MLFVLRPDNEGTAAAARVFAASEAMRSWDAVEQAQARLDDAIAKYDTGVHNWGATSAIAAAEENLEIAQATHAANLKKLEWETKRQWMKKIAVNPKAMPTPWVHDLKTWLKIFRYHSKPTQQ